MSAIRTRLQVAVAVLTVSIAVCGFVVWVVSADARRQIDQLATANSDSIQWSLAQSEVELLALLVAVGDARARPGDPAMLAEVRTRFDILYSRMRTLTTGRVFQTLRQDDPARRRLDQTEAALDAIVPLIDGSARGITPSPRYERMRDEARSGPDRGDAGRACRDGGRRTRPDGAGGHGPGL